MFEAGILVLKHEESEPLCPAPANFQGGAFLSAKLG